MLVRFFIPLRRLTPIVLLAVSILSGVASYAHDPGLSTAEGVWRDRSLELTTSFSPRDATQLLPDLLRTDVSSSLSGAEFEQGWRTLAAELWEVKADGVGLKPDSVRVVAATRDNISFVATFSPPASVGSVVFHAARLSQLPLGHRQFFIITDAAGRALIKKMLSAKDDQLAFSPPVASMSGPKESAGPTTFWAFLRLGIEHIWTGYDHLLFLFALLVVCRTFRSILAIISCFTLAHSLTLALATLGIVNVSSRITEPAIAASIVFVGIENLVRRGAEPRGRWALTFAFGLIHGFGFASVLRDLGVGAHGEGVALPLFTFNLGVEIGQVAVAAIVLPIVWYFRRNERFVRAGVPVLSAIVAGAGTYWLLQRTVFA
jgi:hydrogenase/urease accessory protein HupE